MFSSVVVNVFQAVVCIECRAVCDSIHSYTQCTQYTPQLETLYTTTLLNI